MARNIRLTLSLSLLFSQGPSSYVVAEYEHGDILHLALHRLLEVNVSTMQFERPKF